MTNWLSANPFRPVDPKFWKIEKRFGVAGGPDVVVLTEEGNDRAFAVGAQTSIEAGKALQKLDALGGRALFSVAAGAKHRPGPLAEWDQIVWGRLQSLGYVKHFPS